MLPTEIEAEALLLESIADSVERGDSPRLSVEIRHIAQVVRLSRGLSTVSVSIDGVAAPFHAVTELFFTELPTFPAETLATGAHIHLWQKPRAEQVLTLFSPSVGNYAVVSPFSVQAHANATGELLNRRGDSWQTAAGAIVGGVFKILGNCETLQPPRDEFGFGCRQAVFSLAIDATVTAATVASTVAPASRRLVVATTDVEGVLLPAVGILPSPASRF